MLTTTTNGFLLPTCKGTNYIVTAELIRIEAISNYSKLYFNNGKTLVVAKVLSWFEAKLSKTDFLRTHRTHLIHKKYITGLSFGASQVQLYNGEKVSISRRRKVAISVQIQS